MGMVTRAGVMALLWRVLGVSIVCVSRFFSVSWLPCACVGATEWCSTQHRSVPLL